ncbi:MAG: redoxin domain-containing protein [Verrucomicrobia bacterium]|nr:redoxin domain-containing protein [Verrucomicrobiota bacterium]
MLTIGASFPAFQSEACNSLEGNEIITLSNGDFAARWQVYFFYPQDFTFICPTEIVAFNSKMDAFTSRDIVVIGGSTDNEFCHLAWRKAHEDLREIDFPLIAAGRLAGELGILDADEKVCLRATFIVDPRGIIQYAGCHNLNVGRNVDEILRVLDALQSDELCPCNWEQGEATLKP